MLLFLFPSVVPDVIRRFVLYTFFICGGDGGHDVLALPHHSTPTAMFSGDQQFFHETDTLFLEFFFRHARQRTLNSSPPVRKTLPALEEITQEAEALLRDYLVAGLMALAVASVFQPVQSTNTIPTLLSDFSSLPFFQAWRSVAAEPVSMSCSLDKFQPLHQLVIDDALI